MVVSRVLWVQPLNDFKDEALSDRVYSFEAFIKDTFRDVEESDEDVTDRFVVDVLHDQVQHVRVIVDVRVHLSRLVPHQHLEQLTEVPAKHRVQFFISFQKGKKLLKELILVLGDGLLLLSRSGGSSGSILAVLEVQKTHFLLFLLLVIFLGLDFCFSLLLCSI